ncbi:MAG: type II secretion system F family protein [Rhodospirillales bacterium]|nr:type II secretion system F family protein [Rhodospirillales bacterium]
MNNGVDTVFFGLFIGSFVALLGVIYALRTATDREAARLRRRLVRVGGRMGDDATGTPNVRLGAADERFASLERMLVWALPNREMVVRRLARTGRDISLSIYALICAATAVACAIGLVLALPRVPALGLIGGAIAGLGIPHLAVGWIGKRRSDRFLALFPEAIELIVRGLKSGLPVMESIASVGRDLPDPMGAEFRRIADGVRLGRSVEEALWETAGRIELPEFNFFVISISVQRETGGNLAETLQNLADILRRRQQMRLKVKAMSSEARASAFIIGSLPFIMIGTLQVINPGYVSKLFTDPRGLMLLGLGLTSEVIGVFVMIKMARFEI